MFQVVGSFPFLMGILSGYPVGAKIVTDMRNQSLLTQAEAERLLAFTNNSGPLFIIGTVGISLFGNVTIGILLFITHLLACLSVGFLFRFWKYDAALETAHSASARKNETSSPQWDILASSIMSAIHTVVLIGGFVVLFSVILSILQKSGFLTTCAYALKPICYLFHINPDFCIPFLSGIFELTNGVSGIATIPDKSISIPIVLSSFLLGFAGLSILLQVYSIITKSDISIKPYLLGKLLQGTLASIYTYLIIKNVSFFNLDLEPVFLHSTSAISTTIFAIHFNYYLMLALIILAIMFLVFYLKKQTWKHYRHS